MTIVGLDDTDSREGECTTYVASRIADRLAEEAAVERTVLFRCNPAVEHKTRGNAALAVHTDASPRRARAIARSEIESMAARGADAGLVVAPGSPERLPPAVRAFSRETVWGHLTISDALSLCQEHGYRTDRWQAGRGVIGALAAIGAWGLEFDWTVEHIAYRAPELRGTPRRIDATTVADLVSESSSSTWDTVDRGDDELLCAPRTPCPVLYGIRGESQPAVRTLSDAIGDRAVREPIERERTFVTNQGTDAHLRPGRVGALRDGFSYRVDGRISQSPETRRGGHVFLELQAPGVDDTATVDVVAFEPTKRFRDIVRRLREGDRITACGEVSDGTVKLEKLALRERVEHRFVVPSCPECGQRMASAGADAGYRCRSCGESVPGRVKAPLDRTLNIGWYEVPPRARRHIAKPLVRGGFDAPVHIER